MLIAPKACDSCHLGILQDHVCDLCAVKFCPKCEMILTPSSNLPEANCLCRPLDWHTPGYSGPSDLNE